MYRRHSPHGCRHLRRLYGVVKVRWRQLSSLRVPYRPDSLHHIPHDCRLFVVLRWRQLSGLRSLRQPIGLTLGNLPLGLCVMRTPGRRLSGAWSVCQS